MTLNKPYDATELQARVSNMLVLRSKQKKLPDPASFLPAELSSTAAPASVRGEDPNALVDVNMTLKRLGDDEALLGQVARVFTRTAPALLTSLGAALAAKDVERAYAEAHSLKGAVAVFEAPEVFNSIVAVETHAVNHDVLAATAAFAAAHGLVERLIAELASLAPLQPARGAQA